MPISRQPEENDQLVGDELSVDDLADLHRAIEEAEAEIESGQVVSEEELWTRLRKTQ